MTRFARHPDGRKRALDASSWEEMKDKKQDESESRNQQNDTEQKSDKEVPKNDSQQKSDGEQKSKKSFGNPKGGFVKKEKNSMFQKIGDKKQSQNGPKKSGCFNCGQKGHKVSDCPNPSDGYRDSITCRACNEKGHKQFNCPNAELKAKYEEKKSQQKGKFNKKRDFKTAFGENKASHVKMGFKKKFTESEDNEAAELKTMWKKAKRSENRRVKRQQKEEDNKACFKCRQFGHKLAECPEAQKDVEHGSGICFKCGSTEHGIAKCPVKLPPGKFPFAKCFICGETGHLSRQCPDNPRGLYPNGGCCDHCSAVDHLKKDCPEFQATAGGGGVKLTVLKQGGSLDTEDQLAAELAAKKKPPKPASKKPKVVTF